MTLTTL